MFTEVIKDDLVSIYISGSSGNYIMLYGYTQDDLIEYLTRNNITYEEYAEVSLCNTGIVLPNGDFLNYYHDVERFSGSILSDRPTYFD